jgi:hypothetical protein
LLQEDANLAEIEVRRIGNEAGRLATEPLDFLRGGIRSKCTQGRLRRTRLEKKVFVEVAAENASKLSKGGRCDSRQRFSSG